VRKMEENVFLHMMGREEKGNRKNEGRYSRLR
jgi:hypothetical protein